MDKKFFIGVDIGGTHTDAILMDGEEKILQTVKTTTTEDISEGFKTAIARLLEKAQILSHEVGGVCVGTTHATNALLQKRDLYKAGVIRIAGHMPTTLPVGFSWPASLREAIVGGFETIAGGWECDGGALTPFSSEAAREAISRLLDKGVESLALVGVFSPLKGEQEREVAEMIRSLAGKDFPVSLSSEIGGIGFIERENSTLLNASLKRVMRKGFEALQKVCDHLEIVSPLFITQNDGSLMDLQKAVDYPILTLAAGPTNSFIGGARLSGRENAIVVDVGGTSTDIGYVKKGFPQRSLNQTNIGGVALNFSMPDVLSIALGGGSIVDLQKMVITPVSVGRALKREALSFGGSRLTLTDIAFSLGFLDLPRGKKPTLSQVEAASILEKMQQLIRSEVIKMQGSERGLPVVLVGGGASLLPKSFIDYEIPTHFDVANAYGSALSEISGSVDKVVSLSKREETLEALREEARRSAILQGAAPETVRLVDESILPYHYVPGQMARVWIRCCGKRQLFI